VTCDVARVRAFRRVLTFFYFLGVKSFSTGWCYEPVLNAPFSTGRGTGTNRGSRPVLVLGFLAVITPSFNRSYAHTLPQYFVKNIGGAKVSVVKLS
jgi:hypothetical protein